MFDLDSFLEKEAQAMIDADQMEKEAGVVEMAKNFGKDLAGRGSEIKPLQKSLDGLKGHGEESLGDMGPKMIARKQAKIDELKNKVKSARGRAGGAVAGGAIAAGVGGAVAHHDRQASEIDDQESIEVTASYALVQANAMREAALESLFEAELMKQAAEEILIPLLAKEAGLID